MLDELSLYNYCCLKLHSSFLQQNEVVVSHEKDSFNKNLRNYNFDSEKVDSSVKNQVLAVL